MAEYIKREDALDAWYDKERYTDIEAIPSADVEERKKGKWKNYIEDGYLECPFCGAATNCDGDIEELHFCFSCGARMDGE